MLTIESLMEQIVESMKLTRKYGTKQGMKFPTVYDLSKITWNSDEHRIELDLLVDGEVQKYDMWIYNVKEHGETADGNVINE